jgi:hypothetical protein
MTEILIAGLRGLVNGICYAMPVGIGIWLGFMFGTKYLKENITLRQTVNFINRGQEHVEERALTPDVPLAELSKEE